MDAKRILTNTLFELLKTYKFENITVKMILDESSISHATFYRYFNDKYDMASWYYRSYVETLFNKNEKNWHDFFQDVYQFIYDNNKYFFKLLSVQGESSFWHFLYDFSYSVSEKSYLKKANRTELTAMEKVELKFFIAGNTFVVEEWVRNGVKEPVRDIVDWVCKLIPEKYRCFGD